MAGIGPRGKRHFPGSPAWHRCAAFGFYAALYAAIRLCSVAFAGPQRAPAVKAALPRGSRLRQQAAAAPGGVVPLSSGQRGTRAFRQFYYDQTGAAVSPWHDIPLYGGKPETAGEVLMVTEIPKNSRAKFEVATKVPMNPIAQDIKNGMVREYPGPIYWNYGCLPQTWEDPNVMHPGLRVFGDNDPLDAVEIGSRGIDMGQVRRVKVLGAVAMVDSGELDWKIIVIDCKDELANRYNTLSDVQPEVVSGIREWFRWYKSPDGKPLNTFGDDLQRLEALEVVKETHEAWHKLRRGQVDSKDLWVAPS